MKRFFAPLLLALCLSTVVVAAEKPVLVHKDNTTTMTYQLDDVDGFWQDVRDTARAGKDVQVRHEISIVPVKGLWGTLGPFHFTYHVTYSPFKDVYIVTLPNGTQQELADEAAVNALVRGLQNIQLPETMPLQTGDEYRVNISITVREGAGASWMQYIPFNTLFRTRLSGDYYYIAR